MKWKKIKDNRKPSGGYELLQKVHWQPLMVVANKKKKTNKSEAEKCNCTNECAINFTAI